MLVSRPPDKRMASAKFRSTADSRAALSSRIILEEGTSDCVLAVKTNVAERKFYIR
jgi:hypothetical protein